MRQTFPPNRKGAHNGTFRLWTTFFCPARQQCAFQQRTEAHVHGHWVTEMTTQAERIEAVARQLHELDRQQGLQWSRWGAGPEEKRERYRARAREMLAGEGFAAVMARLGRAPH